MLLHEVDVPAAHAYALATQHTLPVHVSPAPLHDVDVPATHWVAPDPSHAPHSLHDAAMQAPQLAPHTGSAPQIRAVQSGVHTHVPALQLSGALHEPQLWPQRGSSPHSRPVQSGTQVHVPDAPHVSGLEQVPQLDPHRGSTPHSRPAQSGTHVHAPVASQVSGLVHAPQLDPHRGSTPHSRPAQSGTQMHVPDASQASPLAHVPQLCAHIGSGPHSRPAQSGVHAPGTHAPPSQRKPASHVPHAEPQRGSGPHATPVQSGTHASTPPSPGTPASSTGMPTQPRSTLQKDPVAHCASSGSIKHAPSMHRAVAHALALVHSVSSPHSGSPQPTSPEHDGSTQRPAWHSVAAELPAGGHETPRQSRVITTVTAACPAIVRSVLRRATSLPAESTSATDSACEPGGMPVSSATRRASMKRSVENAGSWDREPGTPSSSTTTAANSRPGWKSVRRSTNRAVPPSHPSRATSPTTHALRMPRCYTLAAHVSRSGRAGTRA